MKLFFLSHTPTNMEPTRKFWILLVGQWQMSAMTVATGARFFNAFLRVNLPTLRRANFNNKIFSENLLLYFVVSWTNEQKTPWIKRRTKKNGATRALHSWPWMTAIAVACRVSNLLHFINTPVPCWVCQCACVCLAELGSCGDLLVLLLLLFLAPSSLLLLLLMMGMILLVCTFFSECAFVVIYGFGFGPNNNSDNNWVGEPIFALLLHVCDRLDACKLSSTCTCNKAIWCDGQTQFWWAVYCDVVACCFVQYNPACRRKLIWKMTNCHFFTWNLFEKNGNHCQTINCSL